jgi:FixJ family two-component response regulator
LLLAFSRHFRPCCVVSIARCPFDHAKEIASTLKISVRTVEGHRRVVLRKMGVSSVAHLARAVARLERT